MSIQAVAWAIDLEIKDGLTKLLLVALANRADPTGLCWPSLELLVHEAAQSQSSVQRRLKWLIKEGLIRQENLKNPRTGRQQSNRYFLNWAGVKPEAPQEDDGLPVVCETTGPEEAPQDELPMVPETTGPVVKSGGSDGQKQGGPVVTGDHRHNNALNRKEPSGGTVNARASARDPQDDLFQEWWEAYPQHGHGFSKDRARAIWRALNDEDRALALEQVKRITGKHMSRGKPKDPAWWLQDRIFATMAEERRETALEGAYFGRPDTPQWEAWAAHMGKRPCDRCDESGYVHLGLHPTCWHGGHRGRWFTSEWPPARPTAAVPEQLAPLL